MSNFEKKLEEASVEDLRRWINEYDFRIVPLASDELTRRSLQKLTKVIQGSAKTTEKYNKKLIILTWIIATLTLLMFIGLGVQIYLLIK